MLQLLTRSPRGISKDMLVLAHGFSSNMLAMLVLAGLATVATETLRAGQSRIERMLITDAGKRARRLMTPLKVAAVMCLICWAAAAIAVKMQ